MAWAGVKLPPSLPITTFVSTESWQDQRVGALVIYCSDGRWNEAFDEFCHHSLMIPRYDRFVLPGGPAFLARSGTDTLQLALRPTLDYLVKAHQLQRIVLITHYGCGHYHELLQKPAEDCLTRQIEDTLAAADLLGLWYQEQKLSIESYLAMRQEQRLSFHQLNAAPVQPEVSVAAPSVAKVEAKKVVTPGRTAAHNPTPTPYSKPGPKVTPVKPPIVTRPPLTGLDQLSEYARRIRKLDK